MRQNGYRTALGGILSALSVAIMLLGSLFPFATYAVPAISSFAILYFCMEFSKKHALLVLVVISILALTLVPDKETAFIFSFIFGPYPILKAIFESLKSDILCWALKIVSFNIEVLFTYFLLLRLVVSSALAAEFSSYSTLMLISIILLGNVTFIIFDIALTRVIRMYITKIRPRLTKKR